MELLEFKESDFQRKEYYHNIIPNMQTFWFVTKYEFSILIKSARCRLEYFNPKDFQVNHPKVVVVVNFETDLRIYIN